MSEAASEGGEASRFYIESAASFQERRPRALKHGHTFAVFDPRGDIVAAPAAQMAFIIATRGICRVSNCGSTMRQLLLLSSNVQEDNVVLTVDLTNPDLGARRSG